MTNVFLGMIVCLLVFLCLEQKLSIEKSQATQERFFNLINTHFSHVEIENFKKEIKNTYLNIRMLCYKFDTSLETI